MPNEDIKSYISGGPVRVTAKVVFVGFLILVLLIPLVMIQSLVYERKERQEAASRGVMQTWGSEQTVGGPVLTVPYQTRRVEYVAEGKPVTRTETHFAYFLPDHLEVEGRVDPEVRYRGIYRVPLYQVALSVKGRFAPPDLSARRIPEADVLWEDAFLSVGIPDPRAIKETVVLSWDQAPLTFGPGKAQNRVFGSGIEVTVPGLRPAGAGTAHAFAFNLNLAGSRQLHFVPAGKETHVALTSTWPTPSFSGAYLPATRAVTGQGFTARWKVLYLGRQYPQHWVDNEVPANTVTASAFGVDLLFAVDTYQTATRSVKYGALFILLTFMAFFLFEVLSDMRIHPIQYLLVGFALCLFYLLLLSLSEHLRFGPSYAAATAGTVLLIAGYSVAVLRNRGRAAAMAAQIAGLYGYLYILLQAEDYALLLGSLGLFLILGVVMFITRKVDWYALGAPRPRGGEGAKSS